MTKKNPYYSKKPRKGKWFLDKQEADNCIIINDAFNHAEHYTNHLLFFFDFVEKTYPDVPKEILESLRQKYNDMQGDFNNLFIFLQNKMVAANDANMLLYQHKIKVKE